jgi:hypothetical protein
MPKSKSKSNRNARAASTGGLTLHPANASTDCMVQCRLGSEAPMRLPDETSVLSATTNLPDDFLVTADANGYCGFYINPGLGYYTVNNTTPLTEAATITFNPLVLGTRANTFLGQTIVSRNVCTKVVVTYVSAVQTSAGYLSIQRTRDYGQVSGSTPPIVRQATEMQCKAQEGFTAYLGYGQSPRFEDPNGANYMYNTFQGLSVFASALPPGGILKVRIVRFMEFIPSQSSLMQGDQAVEPHNPAAIAVGGMLANALTTFHMNSDSGFANRVKTVANAAYHLVQPVVPYLANKARTYLSGALSEVAPLMLGM